MLVPALFLAVQVFLPGTLRQPAPAWRTDLDAATKDARAAGKDVLVEFTVRGDPAALPELDRLVFDNERFRREAGERFVLVRLAVKTDGAAGGGDAGVVTLAEQLGVNRIPSLVLMDGTGRPYAAVESEDTSVTGQLAQVFRASTARTARDAALALADDSTGPQRARHLDAALQRTGRFAVSAYEPTVAEVVALDPDNALGLKEKYVDALAARRIDRAVQATVYPLVDRADFPGAIAAIDAILASEKPPVAHAQTLTAFKGQILYSMGKKKEARRMLEQALSLASDTPAVEPIRAAMERIQD
jgi:tetratricopeptide (TPR) repeat protein